jgi:alanyl-tRNA synthetase
MKKLTADQVRAEFLKYFEENGHKVCTSHPLVPPNDATLLFTNAGMVQFKDIFTGQEKKNFSRATSSQKCVRAGGKHNDLENVGFTARHHTFFEMLGNFSFGDYFKREAIAFGWDFLTERLGLSPEHMWVSVFEGDPAHNMPADDEAAAIWEKEIGVPKDRILRFGVKDNFWSMGDTGPCGPCSEIHYDQGPEVPCTEAGECQGVACECDRYLEVWNLVFMQFNRDASGTLSPLPAPSIDTGMGLERLAAVVQQVQSNYDTDLFTPLLNKMGEIAGKPYGASADSDAGLRIVADHARATAFLMSDGVLPSNEGRGYVLRRIMRRAIRHGSKLGVDKLFLHRICQEVVERMGKAFPELHDHAELIDQATRLEEETFRRTLDNGLKLLSKEIGRLKAAGKTELPGKLVFELKTRDGFPTDLTKVIAVEHELTIDRAGYEVEWKHHQEVSAGDLGLAGVDEIYKDLLSENGPTEFSGYGANTGQGRVLAMLTAKENEHALIDSASAGQEIEAIISPSPFYGESGGQIGDQGMLRTADGLQARVLDTLKPLPDLAVHRIRIETGELKKGATVELEVDERRRQNIRLNHSATHLLQASLRKILGKHVNQKGSLVAPDRLRFDFSHFAAMTAEQIKEVEREVNEELRRNHEIQVEEADMERAREAGATMLFGEKYADKVRMVRMGPESLELCGGTHTARTGDIGLFLIISEGAVQAGVRRLEAVTGPGAIEQLQRLSGHLGRASEALKTSPTELADRALSLVERERKLAREVNALKQKLATAGAGHDPTKDARDIGGVRVLATRVEGIELSGLRDFADQLRDKLGGGIVLAAAEVGGKMSTVCTVAKELSKQVKAGDLLKGFFAITGGRGGGRPDFAQGGGGDPKKVAEAIEAFYSLVEKTLGA